VTLGLLGSQNSIINGTKQIAIFNTCGASCGTTLRTSITTVRSTTSLSSTSSTTKATTTLTTSTTSKATTSTTSSGTTTTKPTTTTSSTTTTALSTKTTSTIIYNTQVAVSVTPSNSGYVSIFATSQNDVFATYGTTNALLKLPSGAHVTIQVVPFGGELFSNWQCTSGCLGAGTTQITTISSNVAETASFIPSSGYGADMYAVLQSTDTFLSPLQNVAYGINSLLYNQVPNAAPLPQGFNFSGFASPTSYNAYLLGLYYNSRGGLLVYNPTCGCERYAPAIVKINAASGAITSQIPLNSMPGYFCCSNIVVSGVYAYGSPYRSLSVGPGSGNIVVINMATGKFVTSIIPPSTAAYYNKSVLSPNGQYLYTITIGQLNSKDQIPTAISVASTSTNKVVASIPLDNVFPQNPVIAPTPNGQYLYVLTAGGGYLPSPFWANAVSVVSTSTDKVVAVIPNANENVKSGSYNTVQYSDLVVSPQGNYAYVTEFHNNESTNLYTRTSTLLVINTATNLVSSTVSLPGYRGNGMTGNFADSSLTTPEFMAFSQNNAYLYVVNQGESCATLVQINCANAFQPINNITVISTSTNQKVGSIPLCSGTIDGVSPAQSSNYLYVECANSTIWTINTLSNKISSET
jgi:hypothetical protein